MLRGKERKTNRNKLILGQILTFGLRLLLVLSSTRFKNLTALFNQSKLFREKSAETDLFVYHALRQADV